MKRTWYQRTSDGTFFRNCPLIMEEMKTCHFWQLNRLQEEWDETFRVGVRKSDTLPKGDRAIPYDDSPEATAEWVKEFLAGRGR